MPHVLRSHHTARLWLRRLGRFMAVVTQLVVLLAPIAETHADRQLGAHVEAPRSVPHPGQHNPDSCPACQLLSLHGRIAERQQLPELLREVGASAPDTASRASGAASVPSNSSRAPPLSL